VSFVETRVQALHRGPGRPAELPVRTALVCFVLLGLASSSFFVLNLPTLLASLTWRTRRLVGVDYRDRRGRPKQVSYQQLLRAFHAIASAFDPCDPELSFAEANERAADLRELSFRLVQASITSHPRRLDLAVDATLKWGWDRPGGLHAKVERRGKDGDAGSPLSLGEIVEEGEASFVRDPLAVLRANSRRKNGPKTWGPGSAWVGRPNVAKSVYGVALHALTVSTANAAPVIEAISVTPAPALPATAALPLLSLVHIARSDHRQPLGDVVADPAYSANPGDWQHPIRELGASPIFRLHRTNQAGRRLLGGVTFVDGRPYCPCIPDELAELSFPRFPARKAQYTAFSVEVTKRRRFEMKPNTGFRDDGSRQFRFPHWDPQRAIGGCPHCVKADGTPAADPETGMPRVRCCTQATKVITREDLGLYQDVAFGEAEWFRRWNARDRVEGAFGSFKHPSLANWGHGYHHFVGLVRETLVATFAVIAHNCHAQRTWGAKLALAALPTWGMSRRRDETDDADTMAPVLALPTPRGPKGLEFLGSPRAGP